MESRQGQELEEMVAESSTSRYGRKRTRETDYVPWHNIHVITVPKKEIFIVLPYLDIQGKVWQELHASPHIEHTPHIVLSIFIIHQIFLLARDWSKPVT